MNRLIDYRPELELSPVPLRTNDTDMLAADLLAARQSGRLHHFLQAFARSAGLSPPAAARIAQMLPRALHSGGRAFGMELEGLSPEDKEMAIARQFMRFARFAVRRTCQLERGDPRQTHKAVLAALNSAARQHAPGIKNFNGTAAPLRPLQSYHNREQIMHDIDRTTMEFGNEMGYEGEQFEFGEAEWGGQQGMLTEADEMELANELLSVTNEAELDQFLGSFLKKAANFAGNVIKSPVGQAIGGVLKGVAKKALPLAGGALGGFVGGPLGAKIGSGLASAAGSALGLEAEGELSGEDREFEGARTFVKLAADTVNRAAQSGGGDPRQVAMQAATAAARQLAPGLLQKGGMQGQMGGRGMQGRGQTGQMGQFGQMGQMGQGGQCNQMGQGGTFGGSRNGAMGGMGGRWVRQGRKIVLYGA